MIQHPSPPDLSVCICTHNRPDMMARVLKTLERQTYPSEKLQVLVIDNASRQCHADAVRELCGKYGAEYIFEPVLGLSQARNMGWKKAKANIVAYLDDDVTVHPEWAAQIMRSFNTVEPRPDVVGGEIKAEWATACPAWVPRRYLTFYSLTPHLKQGFLPKNQEPWGANIAYDRKLLEEVGGFSTHLGRRGTNLLSGEETLVKMRIRDRGKTIYFNKQSIVWHYIPRQRIKYKWLIRRIYWYGISETCMTYIRTVIDGQPYTPSRYPLIDNKRNRWGKIRQIIKYFIPLKRCIREHSTIAYHAGRYVGYLVYLPRLKKELRGK